MNNTRAAFAWLVSFAPFWMLAQPNGCPNSTLGHMSQTQIESCTTASFSATYDENNESIPFGKIRSFILHSDSTAALGQVFAIQKTPVFYFDEKTMETKNRFFVSAVSGADDGSGLVNLADSCLKITLGQPVRFHTPPTTFFTETHLKICLKTDPTIFTFVNFKNLLAGGDTTGVWHEVSASGAVGQFPILDFSHVGEGKYTFFYTTAAAVAPCADTSYAIEIEILDCSCPSLAADSLPIVCQSDARISLDFLTKNKPGSWSIASAPLGSTAELDDHFFDATHSFSGTYVLSFAFENLPNSTCTTTDSLQIRVTQAANAGEPTTDFLTICSATDSLLFLKNFLTNADLGGSWKSVAATDQIFLDEKTSGLKTKNLTIGAHRFFYEKTGETPCASDSAFLKIVVFETPTAEAGPNFKLNCFEKAVKFSTTPLADSLAFFWSNAHFKVIAQPTTSDAGRYFLTVKNERTGCAATDSMEVFEDVGLPKIVKMKAERPHCFGEKSASISLDSISGGNQPLLFSIENQSFSLKNNWNGLGGGIFNLKIQDALGCETDTILSLLDPPPIHVFAGRDTTILLGDSIQILPEANFQIADFSWSSSAEVCEKCISQMVAPMANSNFLFRAADENGCTASSQFSVTVRRDWPIFLPTIFQPENSRDESVFYPNGAARNGGRVARLAVFSRAGELVFEKKDMRIGEPSDGWDGRFRGKIVPSGVFVWVMELVFADGATEIRSGDVTVVH